jgi:hypothetical protein
MLARDAALREPVDKNPFLPPVISRRMPPTFTLSYDLPKDLEEVLLIPACCERKNNADFA